MFRSSKNNNKSWTQNSTLNLTLLDEHLISSLFAKEPIYKAGLIIVMPVAGWATGLALIYKDPEISIITSFLPRAAQKPGTEWCRPDNQNNELRFLHPCFSLKTIKQWSIYFWFKGLFLIEVAGIVWGPEVWGTPNSCVLCCVSLVTITRSP